MKRALLALVVLALLVVAGGATWLYVYGSEAMGRAEFWEREIEAFEAADAVRFPEPGLVLFTGSSSIRLWSTLHEDMAPLRVLNRGFGGAHMAHVVHYADRLILPYAPRALVVYAGDNDIGAGKSPAAVAADFRALVAKVRGALPGLPIYYLTIKPSRLRWSRWPEMDAANGRIADFAASDPAIHVLDVSTPMLELGRGEAPPADLFAFDGLHLSEAGYALWTRVVRPRLLGDPGATPAPGSRRGRTDERG
jgi:lysophospholipase L1-like esterase